MPSTTIITGGAGFIGSHLAERLRSRGERVTLIDDLSTGRHGNVAHLLGDECELIEGRVSDVLRDRPALLRGATGVYHLAASVGVQLVADDPAAIIGNNVSETAALFDALRAAGSDAVVLLASTSEVYGKLSDVPLRENADLLFGPPSSPRFSYALSKALDEHLALAHKPGGRCGAIVTRLFNTIGPRQLGRYGMVVPRFVHAAVTGQPLTVYGDGEQTRAFCDVRDVVSAMTALMSDAHVEACRGRVFNLGAAQEISINALAERIIQLADSSSRIEHVPFEAALGEGMEDPFRRRVPDLSRLREVIGFEPSYSLDQTLKELIAAARARVS